MTDVQLKTLAEPSPDAIYRHYDGLLQPQPCWITLDLQDGELAADYNPAIGNAIPEGMWHRRILAWDIPCLTSAAANELLRDLQPIAQRVLDGATIEWDDKNNVGILNEAAEAAYDEITAHIERYAHDLPKVSEVDAGDFFAESAGDLGVQADMTDDDLARLAQELQGDAQQCADNPGDHVVVRSLDEFLTSHREDLRNEVRDELDAVAARFETVRLRRDAMIVQLAGWGDSSRRIAELAGLSHVGVQKIVNR